MGWSSFCDCTSAAASDARIHPARWARRTRATQPAREFSRRSVRAPARHSLEPSTQMLRHALGAAPVQAQPQRSRRVHGARPAVPLACAFQRAAAPARLAADAGNGQPAALRDCLAAASPRAAQGLRVDRSSGFLCQASASDSSSAASAQHPSTARELLSGAPLAEEEPRGAEPHPSPNTQCGLAAQFRAEDACCPVPMQSTECRIHASTSRLKRRDTPSRHQPRTGHFCSSVRTGAQSRRSRARLRRPLRHGTRRRSGRAGLRTPARSLPSCRSWASHETRCGPSDPRQSANQRPMTQEPAAAGPNASVLRPPRRM